MLSYSFPKINKSIVLVGLMGAGKSTIGSRLAKRLGLPFVDTDLAVQEEVGCNLDMIFKYAGINFFKEKEREVITRLINGSPTIISTGDGSFIDNEIRELVKKKCVSIWLQADFETIFERVSRRNTRPILENGDKREILLSMIEDRYPIYAEADFAVRSDLGSHMTIVNSIITSLIGVDA